MLNILESLNNKYSLLNPYRVYIFKLKKLLSKNYFFRKKIKTNPNFKLNTMIANTFSNDGFLLKIKTTRVLNYKKLYESLIKIGIVPIKKISDNKVVPQNLAIIDEIGFLNEYLRKQGIGSYRWPGEELPLYSKEQKRTLKNTLKIHKNIVCLPIHQSLKEQNIKFTVNKIKEYYASTKHN